MYRHFIYFACLFCPQLLERSVIFWMKMLINYIKRIISPEASPDNCHQPGKLAWFHMSTWGCIHCLLGPCSVWDHSGCLGATYQPPGLYPWRCLWDHEVLVIRWHLHVRLVPLASTCKACASGDWMLAGQMQGKCSTYLASPNSDL